MQLCEAIGAASACRGSRKTYSIGMPAMSLQVHHRRVWKYREPRNDVIVDIETMMKTSKTGSWKSIEIQALPHGAFTPLMI
jgi:endonuclease IV